MSSSKGGLLGLGLAALVLAFLPYIPEELTIAVRIVSLFLSPVAAAVLWLAYVPVRVTVGIPRLALLVLAGWLTVQLASGNQNTQLTLAGGGIVYTAFAIAVGPAISVAMRRILYGGVVVLLWGATWFWIKAYLSLDNIFGFAFAVAQAFYLTGIYLKWTRTGRSSVVDLLKRWKPEARDIVEAVTGGASGRQNARRQKRLRRLESDLDALAALPANKGWNQYDDLLAICRNYPDQPLAWKIAYWSAMDRLDLAEVRRLTAECPYQDLLGSTGQATPRVAGAWQEWREADPLFASIQDRLGGPDNRERAMLGLAG